MHLVFIQIKMVGKLFQQAAKNAPLGTFSSMEVPSIRTAGASTSSQIKSKHESWWHFTYIPFCVILILLFLMVLLPLSDQVDLRTQYLLNKNFGTYDEKCRFEIVESLPEGLVFNSTVKHKSTFETWKELIRIAQHTIEIGSFYWSLNSWLEFPNESKQGGEIFSDLLNAGLQRNISIKIAQNKVSENMSKDDTKILAEKGAAKVKSLDFNALLGAGVLHTKFWIVDRKHLYIGSANLDWRALNQVKELGIAVYNCSMLAEDIAKVFEVYWILGNQTRMPDKWPSSLATKFNSRNPFRVDFNGQRSLIYITSSPPQFSPQGREDDIDGLIRIIRNARKFIHISVMDYYPLLVYSRNLRYWPVIDNELRMAVVNRRVKVRILTSKWKSTRAYETNFLKSLSALNKFESGAVLEIKQFIVPSNSSQSKIPYARVNHNKYMVTDNGTLIGTSNWSGDYFTNTAGVSLISMSTNTSVNLIQQQLMDIFDRDWNSPYAYPLE